MFDNLNPMEKIQKHLGEVDFPATKQELVDQCQDIGQKGGEKTDSIMETLKSLPDREYKSPDDVKNALTDIV